MGPRLVAKILGAVKYRRVKQGPGTTTLAEPPPHSAQPDHAKKPSGPHVPHDVARLALSRSNWLGYATDRSSAVDLTFRLLAMLHGRKRLHLRHPRAAKVAQLLLGHDLRHSPLTIEKESWTLDEGHPLVAAVLKSSLKPEEQAPYLASIAFTAGKRLMPEVTDEDDIRFQEALTMLLAPR
jgi:hypothetical protein